MTRRKWIWVFGAVVFVLFAGLIVQKELHLARGESVFLELSPADPRSLIQGDYMRLDYTVADHVRDALREDGTLGDRVRGKAVVRIDEQDVAHYIRLYEGEALEDDEHLLEWKHRGRIHVGANSFLFQEGHADAFEDAEYAELKLSQDGSTLLVGLRDASLAPIAPDAASTNDESVGD